MPPSGRRAAPPVSKRGAAAGSVLRGCGAHNKGLRLRVLQEQARGNEGAIKGGFVILDAGDNIHTPSLRPLLGQVTDAAAVTGAIREAHHGCVSVVNANILVVEKS